MRSLELRIGEAIRRARTTREVKLTQQDIGALVGVSCTSIADYESGRTFPSVPVLFRLAKVLGISLDRLVRGENGKTDSTDLPNPTDASSF